MLVAHLAGQVLHLVERRRLSRTYRVLDSIVTTTGAGIATRTDLMAYDGRGLAAVSNCRTPSVSLYRVGRSSLSFFKEIHSADPLPGYMHGVEFSPDGEQICLINSGGTCRIRVHDVATGDERYTFEIPGWGPKDASYVDAGHLIVSLSDGSPTQERGAPYSSRVALVRLDVENERHEILDVADIPGAHVDAIFHFRGQVAVADQTNGLVRMYRVEGGRVTADRTIGGFAFPHGVCLDRRRLAVTCYGDSSVCVLPRTADEFDPESTQELSRRQPQSLPGASADRATANS